MLKSQKRWLKAHAFRPSPTTRRLTTTTTTRATTTAKPRTIVKRIVIREPAKVKKPRIAWNWTPPPTTSTTPMPTTTARPRVIVKKVYKKRKCPKAVPWWQDAIFRETPSTPYLPTPETRATPLPITTPAPTTTTIAPTTTTIKPTTTTRKPTTTTTKKPTTTKTTPPPGPLPPWPASKGNWRIFYHAASYNAVRLGSDGTNVQCLSRPEEPTACIWEDVKADPLDAMARMAANIDKYGKNPNNLTCGAAHQQVYDSTGLESGLGWCALSKIWLTGKKLNDKTSSGGHWKAQQFKSNKWIAARLSINSADPECLS